MTAASPPAPPARAFGAGIRAGPAVVGFGLAAALAAQPFGVTLFLPLSSVCLALAIGLLAARVARHDYDAADVLYPFLFYFALTIGVRGLAILTYEDSIYISALQDRLSDRFRELVAWCFWFSALGIVFLDLGHVSRTGERWGLRLAAWTRARSTWRKERVILAALLLCSVGVAGVLLYLRTFGGLASLTEDLVYAVTEGALGQFWKFAMMDWLIVGVHLLLLVALVQRHRHASILAAGLVIVVALGLYLLTSSKYVLLRVTVPAFLYVHFLKRRLRLAHLAVPVLAFALLFPVFYAYRGFGPQGVEYLFDQVQSDGSEVWQNSGSLLGRGYDADSFIAVLARAGHEVPFQFGRTLLDLFTFFIPRAWWPEKPMSYGAVFGDQFIPDVDVGQLNYFSPSLPGELYANFHVFGIIAGFCLMGMLLRAAHVMARRGGPVGVFFYGYAYLILIHLVEGGIASKTVFLLMDIAPAAMAVWLVRSRQRHVALARATTSMGSAATPLAPTE